MCDNKNSRKWLVSYDDDSIRVIERKNVQDSIATTLPAIANVAANKYRKSDIGQHKIIGSYSRDTRTARTHSTAAIHTERSNSMIATVRRRTPKLAKVNTCLNQIIEVLLALLLANCLMQIITHLPAPLAAYELNIIDDEAPSIYADYMHRNLRSYRQSFAANLPYVDVATSYDFNESSTQQLQRSQNFKISPKPCNIGRIEGTCMFVWECIKSEGQHVGMCVDSFMFGSCCVHNYTDNIVLPQPFSYTRPTKPAGMANINHRPRPPHQPHRPIISGMTTIERPHGAGTLVIRPSGPHHQGALHRPLHNTKPTTSTQRPFLTNSGFVTTSLTNQPHLSQNEIIGDNLPSPSAANNVWNAGATQQYLHQTPTTVATGTEQVEHHQQQHWHLSTEPNFITKPRPPSWEKPSSLRPKPGKPTKKPIVTVATSERPLQQQAQQTTFATSAHTATRKPTITSTTTRTTTTTRKTTTTSKPTNAQEPLMPYTKPFKPTTTTTTSSTTSTKRPYITRPTTTTTTTSNYEQMQPTKYSTEKQRPSTSSPLTAAAPPSSSSTTATSVSSSSSSPSTSSTSSTSSPSTLSASTAGSSSSSTSTISLATTTADTQRPQTSTLATTPTQSHSINTARPSQTLPPQSHTTIESNEIIDATDGATTIKTISAARSGECGIPLLTRPETRIVGGKSAAFGRWPWQVSVRRTSFFGFSSTHRCGGALINENWIATAGHCVDDLLISQIRIRVGEYDFSHVQEQLPYIERAVAKKVVHPKYNFFTYEYDLALVKLEQPLEFAPHVSPICLPQTDSLLIGMNATVTGWGRLSEGGTLPSVLQEVSVPIVSNDNCKNMFLRAGRQEFIPEIFLCAGYETGGQDSCQGDSGGPLQVKSQDGRFFLAGIISWGIGCAEANLPGVCTRISKFVPWILENVT